MYHIIDQAKPNDGRLDKLRIKDFISDNRMRLIHINAIFFIFYGRYPLSLMCHYMPIFSYRCVSCFLQSGRYNSTKPRATVAPGAGTCQAVRMIQCICHEGEGIYHLSGARCTDVTCTSQPAGASVIVRNE